MRKHNPDQITLDFTRAAAACPTLPLCPVHLLPSAVVALDDPLLKVCDMAIREHFRAQATFDQMLEELHAISHVAEQRRQYGDRAAVGLGGPRTYQDVGTAESAMDWMHDHELHRANQIKLALPSPGEEVEAARLRIQQRIAARKANRLKAAA